MRKTIGEINMKQSVSQTIFQILVALNLIGLTVQFQLPSKVIATGNGKRSQPRTGMYDPEGIYRRIRIPTVVSIGNGKRSRGLSSRVYNPDPINKQWLYNHLNYLNANLEDQSSLLQEKRDAWAASRDWDVPKIQPRDFFPQSDEDGNLGDEEEEGDDDVYGMRNVLKGLDVLTNEDESRLDDTAPYDRLSDYHGEPSVYRNNPLVRSLGLNLKRREQLINLLANKLTNTEFDDE